MYSITQSNMSSYIPYGKMEDENDTIVVQTNAQEENNSLGNLKRENEGLKHQIEELQAELKKCQLVGNTQLSSVEDSRNQKKLRLEKNPQIVSDDQTMESKEDNRSTDLNNNNNSINENQNNPGKLISSMQCDSQKEDYVVRFPIGVNQFATYEKVSKESMTILSKVFSTSSSVKETEEKIFTFGPPSYGDKEYYNKEITDKFMLNLPVIYHKRNPKTQTNANDSTPSTSDDVSFTVNQSILLMNLVEPYQIPELTDECIDPIVKKFVNDPISLLTYIDFASHIPLFEQAWTIALKRIDDLLKRPINGKFIVNIDIMLSSLWKCLDDFELSFLNIKKDFTTNAAVQKKFKLFSLLLDVFAPYIMSRQPVNPNFAKWVLILNAPYPASITSHEYPTEALKMFGNLDKIGNNNRLFVELVKHFYKNSSTLEKWEKKILVNLNLTISPLERHTLRLILGYLFKDNRAKAINYVQEAINIQPACVNAYNFLTYLLMEDNKMEKALEACQSALKLDSSNLIARVRRCLINFHLTKKQEVSSDFYWIREQVILLCNPSPLKDRGYSVENKLSYIENLIRQLKNETNLYPENIDLKQRQINAHEIFLIYNMHIVQYVQEKNWESALSLYNELFILTKMYTYHKSIFRSLTNLESTELMNENSSLVISELKVFSNFQKGKFKEALKVLKDFAGIDKPNLFSPSYTVVSESFQRRNQVRMIYSLYCYAQLKHWKEFEETVNLLPLQKEKFIPLLKKIENSQFKDVMDILSKIMENLVQSYQNRKTVVYVLHSFDHPIEKIFSENDFFT